MKKMFSLLFAVVVGFSATTVAQGNALQQRTALQQKKVQKERVAQAPAQISRPRKAPATTPPTSEYLVSEFGYNLSSQLVLCFYFDVTPCKQVVLTGSFNNWSTDVSECVNFYHLGDYNSTYEGWYIVGVDWASGIQAKPVQLTDEGKFDFANQSGDTNAWIHIGGNEANISAGYAGEANVSYPTAGVYFYEIAYWKNHYDQCATCHYTLKMEDSYNDGWDGGGQLKITDGSHEMYFRCEYGESPTTLQVPYYGGDVTITWVSGSCTSENAINIWAPNGKGLFYHPFGDYMSDGQVLANLPSSTDFCGVNPNPDEPKNVKAVLVDRKMQISWDAVIGATKYRVSVTAPDGSVIAYNEDTTETNYLTDFLPAKGDYTISVASVDNTDLQMGVATLVQNIDLAPLSSAKVTVLVPSECGMDISEGLWISWKADHDATNHIEKMKSLGGRKFSITFNPNDYMYDFFVMNKPNPAATGVHQTYSSGELGYSEFCAIVKSSTDSWHDMSWDEECKAEDFDYRPYNLKVTPLTGDSVRFEWDVKNPTNDTYNVYYPHENGYDVNVGSVVGEVVKLHYVVEAKFNVSQATEFSAWKITYMDRWGNYQSVQGGPFTVGGNAYVPSDLLVTPNMDGTYTITWKTQSAPNHYYFYIRRSDYDWMANSTLTEASYKTEVLATGYEYYVTIDSRDAEDNSLGYAWTTFSTSTVSPKDIKLNIYIPQNAGLSSTEGYALLWNYPGFAKQVAPLTLDSNRWYSTTISVTKEKINVSLINALTEEKATEEIAYKSEINSDAILIVNKNQAGKLFLSDIDPDYNGSDLCPYNLQAEAKNGQLILAWEAAQDAPEYIVYTYNAQGEPINYAYSDKKQYTINVSNDTVATWGWSVMPYSKNGSYSEETRVYAPEPVVIQPSPYIPKNLQATPNSDGTYTISWDAPEASDANKYYVEVYNPSDNNVLYKEVNAITNARTYVLTQAGTYKYYVNAYGKNDRYGYAQSSFELATVAVRDVTVRVLVHEDEPNILTSTILFAAYNSNTKNYEYVTPTDEGNGWFSHTFTTTEPALNFLCKTNDGNYNCTIVGDTCMQFQNGIHGVACDAVALDRRIIPGSLTAVAKEGQVKFSWEVKDISQTYGIKIYDELDNTLTTQYAYGTTEFYYAVPAAYDGKVIKWGVTPWSPVYLAEEKASSTVTLQKGTIVLSNLKLETEDTITLNLSWESSDPTLHYEVAIVYNWNPLKQEVVTTNSYQYTVPLNGTYKWYVRPLYPEDDTPAGQYEEGSEIEVTKVSREWIYNLKGSATGYTLHFSWEKSIPTVSAGIFKQETGGLYTFLDEFITTENSLDYTVNEEGLYIIQLIAYNEYSPGQYNLIGNSYYTSAQVFNGETFSIKLSSTEGGYIWPEGLSGNYPKGFEIEVSTKSNDHYRFVKWSDGVKEPYRTLTMNSDYNLTAIFERIPEYTITINAGENGQVSMGGSNWGETFSDKFEEGNGTGIFAQAESGYTFYEWSDGNKDQNRYVELTSDTTLTAVFKPICTLTIETPENGSIEFTGDYIEKVGNVYTIAYGTQVSLKAKPNAHYRFTGWSDGVKTVQNIFTIEEDKTINATFGEAGSTITHTVTVNMHWASDGNGSVSGTGAYYVGDQIILTATPSEDSEFIRWSDGNTENPRIYTVPDADAVLEALINLKRLNLKLIATEGGTVNFTDSVCKYGTSVECIATPNEHYHFNGWSDGNTNKSRYVDMTADITLTANFEADQYTITFLNENGSFIEANQWGYGSTPECSVTPKKSSTAEYSYKFTGWTPAIEKVTDDAVYTATFKASKRSYTVTFVDWNGKELKTEEVVYGESATAPTAPTREGYTFTGWDKAFDNITEDITVTAQYKPNSQAIDNTDAEGVARKVMESDRIYIILPDGRKYNVLGEKIN